MFELLRERFLQDRENQRNKNMFYIENGYCPTWNDKTKSDKGIETYCTELRWNQYKAGTITREKAIEYATKRMNKDIEKDIEKGLARLDAVAAAPNLSFIVLNVEYKRNSYWGYNPTAESRTNNGMTTGTASGCGYDKESAAVANAFNKNNSILKALYTIKENGLKAGKNDTSTTASSGVDNRNICGYGSGYGVLPYFEGGVGVNCFWDILKKAGYRTSCSYGKHENNYTIEKEVA